MLFLHIHQVSSPSIPYDSAEQVKEMREGESDGIDEDEAGGRRTDVKEGRSDGERDGRIIGHMEYRL